MALTKALFAGQLEPPAIEEMTIDLWPEYDRPATLVMYRFRVASGASPSTPVSIPIPTSVDEPHAVAWRDDKGALFVADYTRKREGDRTLIEARLGSLEGQLEFYGALELDGMARTFRFRWPGGVPVGSLSFLIQQPAGARELRIQPEPTEKTVGQDGLTYARVDLGAQTPSSTPEIEIRYRKDSAGLTDPAPPTADTPSNPERSDSSPWLFGLGGLLAGAGAAWLAWSFLGSRSRTPSKPAEKRVAKAPGGERARFCHECGAKAQASASFCIYCGTRLVTN
ncbi:MAG TPA: zinc ribbon domain-containing protein [Vicinamibacteria bacterium]|nr:zinc ribbon domain-containing protein [Vicinamibacteria bacterium]